MSIKHLTKLSGQKRVEEQPIPSTDKLQGKVLLVEDDPGNIMLASLILEAIPVMFDVAVSGYEAIEKAGSDLYSLIIMDVRLPDISGEEATKIIRNNEKESGRNPVQILCVTANAFVGDSENYLAAGMNDYLSKPYRQEEFERKILRLLKQAQG